MRDRKYRVWGKSNEYPEGKMYYPGDLPIVITLFGDPIHAPSGNKIEDCCYMRVGWNDVDVMQYTGLHDCKGIPIYEGDIVKNWHEWWNTGGMGEYKTEVVEFKDGKFANAYKDSEVIGNIHQYPDLINPPKE